MLQDDILRSAIAPFSVAGVAPGMVDRYLEGRTDNTLTNGDELTLLYNHLMIQQRARLASLELGDAGTTSNHTNPHST